MKHLAHSSIWQSGLIWVVLFIVLDSAQAVFFGNRLQQYDAFLIGGLVFGTTAPLALFYVWQTDRHQFDIAAQYWARLLAINLTVAGAWVTYFYAIQLIEPAIAFTLMSVMLPMVNLVSARFGFSNAESFRNKLEWLGLALMLLACAGLIYVTLNGQSGFVRGDGFSAVFGIAMSLSSGILFGMMLLFGKQMDARGLKPLSQFGFRILVYIFVGIVGAIMGLDHKGPIDLSGLAFVYMVGLLLLALPIYVVQKAVSRANPMSLSALASTAPLVVFLFQLFDGRVDYANATLLGLLTYFCGAIIIAIGVALFERKTKRA